MAGQKPAGRSLEIQGCLWVSTGKEVEGEKEKKSKGGGEKGNGVKHRKKSRTPREPLNRVVGGTVHIVRKLGPPT